MIKHESKFCPRCKAGFECKAGSISLCQCNGIIITDEERQYIGANFSDCLCAECLYILRSEFNKMKFEASVKKALGSR